MSTALAETLLAVEDDDGQRFRLRLVGLEPAAFDALVAQHPAPGEDPGAPWDVDGLAPALIGACLAEPDGLDPAEIWDEWAEPDAHAVLDACLRLCLPGTVDPAWIRLDREPRLAAEMDYCGPRGIPHSVFLGWDRADQAKALAWQARHQATCQGCGTRRDQWKRNRDAFEPVEDRCPGCDVIRLTEKQLPPEALEQGVHVRLIPARDDDEAGEG